MFDKRVALISASVTFVVVGLALGLGAIAALFGAAWAVLGLAAASVYVGVVISVKLTPPRPVVLPPKIGTE